MPTTYDAVKPELDPVEVENRIHEEMRAAFAGLEQASPDQKPEASRQVDEAVRQLYDFVVRGKVPQRVMTA
jgi:hypothetical protein